MLTAQNIKDYLKQYDVIWAVTMPDGCPPEDVLVPTNHTFYRYAKFPDKCSPDDFKTYADLNPDKDWGEMLPLAVGLSIIDDESKAKRNLKLPFMRKFKGIILLTLNPLDGVVKQTGVHRSHYTWWRTQNFDMENLKMLEL